VFAAWSALTFGFIFGIDAAFHWQRHLDSLIVGALVGAAANDLLRFSKRGQNWRKRVNGAIAHYLHLGDPWKSNGSY
jgi:hypothetical protein